MWAMCTKGLTTKHQSAHLTLLCVASPRTGIRRADLKLTKLFRRAPKEDGTHTDDDVPTLLQRFNHAKLTALHDAVIHWRLGIFAYPRLAEIRVIH